MLTTGLFTRGWPLTPSQNKQKPLHGVPALKLCGGSSMHFTERPNICLCSDEEQELKLLTKSVTNFSCAQIWVKIPQRAELVGVGMQQPTFWAADRDACPCDSEIQPSPPQVHWCFCCKFQAPPPQVPLELFQPAPTLPTQLLFTTVLFSPFLGWQKVQADPHWGAESYADTFRGFCSHSSSDPCNAEPGCFRQLSLLCPMLFQTKCPQSQLTFSRGDDPVAHQFIFTITMGVPLQLCPCTSPHQPTPAWFSGLFVPAEGNSPERSDTQHTAPWDTSAPTGTTTFVFIRSSHGNITQSS